MERRIAYFTLFGFLFGGIVGMALGAAQANLPVGAVVMMCSSTGAFLGWFVAIVLERRTKISKP